MGVAMTILIIGNCEPVSNFLIYYLKDFGYHAVSCSLEDSFDLFKDNPDSFDSIIIDSNPNFIYKVIALNAKIKEIKPKMPIIFLPPILKTEDLLKEGINVEQLISLDLLIKLMEKDSINLCEIPQPS